MSRIESYVILNFLFKYCLIITPLQVTNFIIRPLEQILVHHVLCLLTDWLDCMLDLVI